MLWQSGLLNPRGEATGDAALDAAAFPTSQRADQRDVLGARPDERLAHGQVCADIALLVRRSMCRTISTKTASLAERAGVAPVGFYLLAAAGVHGREVRVGDDDLMPESFETAGDPFALGRRLDEDASRLPALE